MQGEVQVGLKVKGVKDLKEANRELLKTRAAAGLAAHRTKKLADNFDKELGPALREVNRKMKQNLVLQQQSQKGGKRLALITQQAGYQFGDLAVQIQGGTNAAVAFGQQMSQLAGFFGPGGAIFGLGIALSTALVAPLIRASEAAKGLKEDIDSLVEDYESKIDQIKFGVDSALEARALKLLFDNTKKFYDLREKYKKTDSLSTKQRIAQESKELKKEIFGNQALVDKLKERREEYERMKGFEKDQAQEAANLAEAQAHIRRKEREASVEKYEAEKKYIRDMEKLFLQSQQRIRQENGKEMSKAIEDRLKELEAAEAESVSRRRVVEKAYILEMANFFLEVQDAKHRAFMARFAAEDALMSQDVVSGSTTDRFGADDLLRMGYTKEYLIAIGKLKEKEAVATNKVRIEVKELTKAQKEQFALVQSIEQSMENSFMSMVDGTKSVSDAFKSMASEIIKELYRIFVVKRVTGMIAGYMSDPAMFGGSPGGNAPMGSVRPKARTFSGGGYTGSSPRAGGLDGKGGFMAMLHPQETVVDHSRGQSGGVTVVQNINISTGVQQTVRSEIRQMMPQIAQSAKAAVVDSKRRGGNYGRAMA